VTTWERHAKIAFIGSHGIRKTTAAHAFASTMQRAGRSAEYGREVVRDNPLGFNEGATGEAQLWVLVSQVRQELELAPKAEVLVTDRGVMDNFAYYLRACAMADLFDVEPLVRAWSRTYDLVVRLTPDIALRPDGVRSTSDAFRDEIEAILDARLPSLVRADRIATIPASSVTDTYDWWPLAERLAAIVGVPLLADGVSPRRRPRRRGVVEQPPAGARSGDDPQLELDLGDERAGQGTR
jgi:nicotinamide riboside kinase